MGSDHFIPTKSDKIDFPIYNSSSDSYLSSLILYHINTFMLRHGITNIFYDRKPYAWNFHPRIRDDQFSFDEVTLNTYGFHTVRFGSLKFSQELQCGTGPHGRRMSQPRPSAWASWGRIFSPDPCRDRIWSTIPLGGGFFNLPRQG